MDGVSTSQLTSVGGKPTGLLVEPNGCKNILDLDKEEILLAFRQYGALIFRGFSIDESIFGAFTERYSSRFIIHANTTKRKAREEDRTIGTVDYGRHFIGPHSELAFLPRPFCPDTLFFHCVRQAKKGGATTLYDGGQIAGDLDSDLRRTLSESLLCFRVPVPKEIWMQVLDVNSIDALKQMNCGFKISVGGLRAGCKRLALNSASLIVGLYLGKNLATMESSDRHFRFANLLAGPAAQKDTVIVEWETPILSRNLFSGQEVFANSLFTGYTMRLGQLNGKKIQHHRSLLAKLQKICEPYKTPIEWRGGELIMVDNTKMMHGRESFEQTPDTIRHVRTRYGLS